MSEKRVPPEFELLGNVRALRLKTVETQSKDLMGARHVRITLREDPDILASCAFGLIYALGMDRGDVAKHWVAKLQGKQKKMGLVAMTKKRS